LPAGRFYRVTETMLDGNWPKHDPNYRKAKPYLSSVPRNEGYNDKVAGGKTIGQAWGRITYKPDLSDPRFSKILTADSNLMHAPKAPFLRLPGGQSSGAATFDFTSPYVLVDGMLRGELAGNAAIEIRALRAKASNRSEPDRWSPWQTLANKPGNFEIVLGRERYNGKDVSIHGVYRFQVRVRIDESAAPNGVSGGSSSGSSPKENRPATAGLNALQLEAYFENGIMSIPQIFEGRNTVHFQLRDSSKLDGPIAVTYKYQTPTGEREHRKLLRASDFRGNEATYSIDAPDLIRCNSLAIAY
jgi:hypothetical protein